MIPCEPNAPSAPGAPSSGPAPLSGALFQQRLTITTFSLITVVLVIYLLREFAVILQPLFIAIFVAYLVFPVHRWLVARGVRSLLAYFFLVVLGIGVLFGLGWMVFNSFTDFSERLSLYEVKLDAFLHNTLKLIPFISPEMATQNVRDLLRSITFNQLAGPLKAALGTFVGVFTGVLVVSLYFIFLIAEKVSFSRRLYLAFTPERADHVLKVIDHINHAISHYLVIKTFVSLITGVLAMTVLGLFQVEFFVMWGFLTFFLNFIPYLGSAVTMTLPIVLTFLQYSDAPWKGAVVGVLLIVIHQSTGQLLEPRMMGQKLGVSPLLILLSLSFWGVLWGVVGMILAVPLLVVIKIILDNIGETKPVATLMSNA